MVRPIHEDGAKTERLMFPVTEDMAEEIKQYWHKHQLDSKSDAIRQLVRYALDAEKKRSK